jgi:hypothetical protein
VEKLGWQERGVGVRRSWGSDGWTEAGRPPSGSRGFPCAGDRRWLGVVHSVGSGYAQPVLPNGGVSKSPGGDWAWWRNRMEQEVFMVLPVLGAV